MSIRLFWNSVLNVFRSTKLILKQDYDLNYAFCTSFQCLKQGSQTQMSSKATQNPKQVSRAILCLNMIKSCSFSYICSFWTTLWATQTMLVGNLFAKSHTVFEWSLLMILNVLPILPVIIGKFAIFYRFTGKFKSR